MDTEALQHAVLRTVRERTRASPREIGRSLWRHGYKNILQVVDALVERGVLRRELSRNQGAIVTINPKPAEGDEHGTGN